MPSAHGRTIPRCVKPRSIKKSIGALAKLNPRPNLENATDIRKSAPTDRPLDESLDWTRVSHVKIVAMHTHPVSTTTRSDLDSSRMPPLSLCRFIYIAQHADAALNAEVCLSYGLHR